MTRPSISVPRRARVVLIAVIAIASAVAFGASSSAPAAAWPAANVDLLGHGWGHGRGMGQYGALGYALDGVGYQDILQRYYANTDVGSLPAGSAVLVRLTTFDGADTIVVQENGELTTKAGPGSFHALRVRYLGANGFAVDGSTADAADCAGGPAGWHLLFNATGPVTLAASASPGNDHTHMLQTCGPVDNRWYRGTLEARRTTVRPSRPTGCRWRITSAASCRVSRPRRGGGLGGGKGANALKAQAVAARSYAQAENRLGGPGTTCDTTSCQVYGGVAVQKGPDFTAARTH